MGGRKSYYVEAVVGKSPGAKRRIIDSVKSGSREKITQTTIEEFVKSSKVVDDLSYVFDTFGFIDEALKRKPTSTEESKKLATKFWAEHKKKEKIETSKEFNKILVDALTKVISRRGTN